MKTFQLVIVRKRSTSYKCFIKRFPYCTTASPENKCYLQGRNFKKSLSWHTAISQVCVHFWWKYLKDTHLIFRWSLWFFCFLFPHNLCSFLKVFRRQQMFFPSCKTKPNLSLQNRRHFAPNFSCHGNLILLSPVSLMLNMNTRLFLSNKVIHQNGLRIWKWVGMSNWKFSAFIPPIVRF